MQFDLSIQPVRIWSREGAATFCRVAKKHGEHSNMNRQFPYQDAGLLWLGSEAQYQAMRFPHLPEHQEVIRKAPSLMASKQVAYERVDETRPDWDDVKLHAMAYVLTRKLGVGHYAELLAATGDRPIIELSTRDDFWGAKPHGDQMVGRNMLGYLLMQMRNGARMDELPAGTTFPMPLTHCPEPSATTAQMGFDLLGFAPPVRRFAR